MTTPNVNHPAVETLRRFFAEMNRWEWGLIKEDFSDLEELPPEQIDAEVDKRRAIQREQLAAIMDKYCEVGRKADRVTEGMYCGGIEPDYNPETEKILSVDDRGDRVIVETQMAHNFKFRYRYELVEVNEQWRVKEPRRFKSPYRDEWDQCGL